MKAPEQKGSLALPRFRTECDVDLSKVLKAMDMGVAFGEGADFGGMIEQPAPDSLSLFLGEVRHKAVVEVNELGTKASAVTYVEVRGVSHRDFDMTVDRPFFYAIHHDQTLVPLFMGWMSSPVRTAAAPIPMAGVRR